jgi:hypothetical protein
VTQVTIGINNTTGHELKLAGERLSTGTWHTEPPLLIEPGTTAQMIAVDKDWGLGVEGRVAYSFDGSDGPAAIAVNFYNPLIGDGEHWVLLDENRWHVTTDILETSVNLFVSLPGR